MRNRLVPILFFIGFLTAPGSAGYAQHAPFLKLSSGQAHELEVEETGPGTYRVITSGTDPYLFTLPLESALEAGNTVLTFDYFSTGYLDHFQVFLGPPIDENASFSFELGVREGWTSHSVDLSGELGEWGKKGDFLRLDFGRKAGYQIQIRNIRFRKPNRDELARIAGRAKKKQEEAAHKAALENYLDKDYSMEIRDVRVKKDSIIIEGAVSGGEKGLYVAEVPLHQHIAKSSTFDNTWPVPGNRDAFRLAVPRYRDAGDHQTDGLLSKWVIVKKMQQGFELRSHARYANHIQSLNNLPEQRLAGKKGLGGFHANKFTSDLDSLGITSVTVNMWISKMMRSRPSEQTISFEYCGKTYYADRAWVESHDRSLQEAARRNILVSSIVLIDKAVNTPDKKIGSIFEHPDCDPAGIYSMANMTSAEGVEYYAAAMDFLAKRYSRPDKKYGRIHHWIIHNEVDAGWVWTNMGEADTLLFMDTYHRSMRLVHHIVRQYNPHAKTFISLTHYWNWTQDKHFYLSRDLLEILLEYSGREGDFDWGIAHHPYPESLFEPKSWLDEKVDFTFDTPLITFKNIEVLDAWVKQPRTMYLGKHRRTVFLSEQGPNSRDYSRESLLEQAASMAYVWKKMDALSGIDAFQFHNWIDNRGEGGLRIGLRRFPDDEKDPGGKKPVWYVFRDLGTPAEQKAIEFAKDIIGITSWNEVRYKGEIKADMRSAQRVPYNYSAGLPATDALGRKLPTYEETGPLRKDKFVGIFYWTWHTLQSQNSAAPYNVMEILAQNPESIHDYNDPVWPPGNQAGSFFWSEPLFGYYLNTDRWVLYKHAEMLADAGVDMIMFDCTNGSFTWKESYQALCEVFTEARKNGIRTPQIAFMLAFGPTEGSLQAMKELYDELYRPGLYQDLWFYWKEKPLIMAYPETLTDVEGDEAATRLHREIKDFFTFRPGQPVYNKGPQRPDHWGWLEIWPQHGFVERPGKGPEQVTVGVAQNWSDERGLTAMNAPGAFGRSYTAKNGHATQPGAVNYGHNFQEQWERALNLDPEFIFITGWNEWIAGRYEEWQQQHNAFPDQFDQEHSRDIEPMKGGHGDNYYYQMVRNIRRFKGMPPPEKPSPEVTVQIDGKFGEWEGVSPEFKAHKGNTLHRNSPGWKGIHYVNTTGRNDIIRAKVARDDKYLYFYVETAEPLSPSDDPAWMRLFIDTDRNKETGWEGYDFVVNRRNPRKKAFVEKSRKSWNWRRAGKAVYAVSANKLELKIEKQMLGLSPADPVDIAFKWSDNMQEDGNILDFMLHGDVAPSGRFNYPYRIKE